MKSVLRICPLFAALALAAVAGGCGAFYEIKERLAPPQAPPHLDAMGALSEPGASYVPPAARLYTPAKGIDYTGGSTEETFLLLDGTLAVEDVRRDDAEGQLKARVRLRNRTDLLMNAEYLIVFFDDAGRRLISERDLWTGFTIEPFGAETAWNGCLLRDADRFMLFVRHAHPMPEREPPVQAVPSPGAPMTPGGGDLPHAPSLIGHITPAGVRIEAPKEDLIPSGPSARVER